MTMITRRAVSNSLRSLGLLNPVRWCKRIIVGSLKDLAWFINGRQRSMSPDAPPPSLCFAVSANYDVSYFLRTGAQGAESIRSILARNHRPIESFGSILDFGCGCGRVARHWKGLEGSPLLTGTDINPSLVKWAHRNLKFGRFLTNSLSSALPFKDREFDLIYAVSVFTHLSENLQKHWITELTRILQPGGVLLITVKGANWKVELDHDQREQFDNDRMVVLEPETSGSNYCGSYHPREYVVNILAKGNGLSVVEHEPCGSLDTRQDFYLMIKPE